MIRNCSREDLDNDRKLNLSLVRLLEIVGEAASQVTEETRRLNAELPWNQMVGLRNRLIHGYNEVDFDILWTILMEDLPPLILQLKRALGDPRPHD